MATVLTLAWHADFAADVDTLNLLNFSAGFDLAESGWVPQVASIDGENVIEVITLHARAATNDALATYMQQLDLFKERVEWSHWMTEARYVALRVAMQGETNPREAMIVNFDYALQTSLYNYTAESQSMLFNVTLTIERSAFWEDPYPYPSTTTKTTISSIGGMVQLSETINGDVPARLAKLSVAATGSGLGITHPPNDYWIGFKTSRLGGDLAKLISGWLFSFSTTLDTDTAIVGDDAVCDFVDDATLIDRTMISLNAVTLDADAQAAFRGSYTVLLRAKMSDSSAARVRMVSGFVGANTATTARTSRSRVNVSGTSYALYDLGSISVPPVQSGASLTLAYFGIIMQAERISGSGSLSMNRLIFIPDNDGFIKAGSDRATSVAAGEYLSVFQRPNNRVDALVDNAFSVVDGATITPIGWSLPANSEAPYLIAASSSRTYYSESMNLTVSYTYIPRWRTLRGGVT